MKSVLNPSLFCLTATLILGAACSKDDIIDTGSSSSSGTSSGTVTGEVEDDSYDDSSFDRTITISWNTSGVSVSGDENGIVSVSGSDVTVDNTKTSEKVRYALSGSCSDGSIKLYSNNKQQLLLEGLSLTNTRGAAINNQGKKSCYVIVSGENHLADGASAAYSTSGSEDMKAVFFSEGQLIFSGSGSLEVKANNAQRKGCIASDDYIHLAGAQTLTLTAGSGAGHGLKANEYVFIEDGNLSATLSGGVFYDSDDKEYKGTDGIKADNFFAMTGGTVTLEHSGKGGKGIRAGSYDYDATSHKVADSYISGGSLSITTSGSESNDVSCKGIKIGWVTKSGSGERASVTGYAGNFLIKGGSITVSTAKSEGIEAKGNLVISGGQTYVYSTGDDAINAQGEIDITGGYVYAHSTANDAIDANHDLKISGGHVFAVTTKGSPEVALDANTEQRYALYLTGGVVVAYGGLESGYSASGTVYSFSGTAGAWNALSDGNDYIAAFKAPSGLSSFAVYAPSLSGGYKGVSVGDETLCNGVWAGSGISGGSAVTLGTYSGGGGPGGGGGGGGRPGGR